MNITKLLDSKPTIALARFDDAVENLIETKGAVNMADLIDQAVDFKFDMACDYIVDEEDHQMLCGLWIARHRDTLTDLAQKYMTSKRFERLLDSLEEDDVSEDYDPTYELTASEQAWADQKSQEYRAKIQAWFGNK